MTQIYLPYPDFNLVAKCLDNKRLNKQITEAKQVYTQNRYGFGGQGNRKPYLMWYGYEYYLLVYIRDLYFEWNRRWRDNERGGVPLHKAGDYCLQELNKQDLHPIKPDWFNNLAIYSTYRSALLYKDYNHYSKFGWSESPIIPIEENGKVVIPYIYGEGIKEKVW